VADSSVVLEVILEGKNIRLVHKQVDKVTDSVSKQKDTVDKATQSYDRFDKGSKGVAQATANGTKAFSKMRNAIGSGSSGLVGAYATLAANVFAATAFFGALRRAAQVDTLVQSLDALGESSGRNLGILAERLQEISGYAISAEQSLKTASFGISAGFDTKTLENLTDVARRASVALGRDVSDSVDRLTRGVAKLEPEILDELGIIVRLDDATEEYAASIGKAASQLTTFERSQAFANAAITQGLEKYSSVENVGVSAYEKLAATVQNLAKTLLGFVNTFLAPFAEFLANNQLALAGLLAALTKGIISQAIPAITLLTEKTQAAALAALGLANAERAKAQKSLDLQKAKVKMITLTNAKYAQEFNLALQQKRSSAQLIEIQKKLTSQIEKRYRNLERATKKDLEAKKEELRLLKEANSELDKMIRKQQTLESKKGVSFGTGKEEQFQRIGAKVLSDLDENPSLEGFSKAFKKAGKAGRAYRNDLQGATAATLGFSGVAKFLPARLLQAGVAFKSFGISAKVALKGISYAIPLLGQALFAFDILKSAVLGLVDVLARFGPKTSEAAKKQQAFSAQLSNYSAQVKNLNKLEIERIGLLKEEQEDQEKSIQLASKRVSQAVAMGNASKDLVQTMKDASEAQADANKEAGIFGKLLNTLSNGFGYLGEAATIYGNQIALFFQNIALRVRVAILDFVANSTLFQKIMNGLIRAANVFLSEDQKIELLDIPQLQADSAAAQAELNALDAARKRAFGVSELKSFRKLIPTPEYEAFKETVEGGGKAFENIVEIIGTTDTAAFGRALMKGTLEADGSVAGLSDTLNDFVKKNKFAADGTLSFQEKQAILAYIVEDSTAEIIKQADAIQSLKSGFKDAETDFNKFMTSLQGGKTSATDLFLRLDSINSSIENLDDTNLEDMSKLIKGTEKQAGLLSKKMLAFLGIDETTTADQVKEIISDFTIQQQQLDNLLRTEKQRLGVITRQRAALSGLLGNSQAAVKTNIALIKQEANERTAALRIQIENQERAVAGATEGSTEQTNALAKLGELKEEQAKLTQESQFQELATNALIEKAGLAYREKVVELTKSSLSLTMKQKEQEMLLNNILSGRGGKLSEKQQYDLKVIAAENALTIAEMEQDLALSRLAIETKIIGAKLKAAGVDGKVIEDIISDLNAAAGLQQQIGDNTIKQARISLENARGGSLLTQESLSANPASGVYDNASLAMEEYKKVIADLESKGDVDPTARMRLGLLATSKTLGPMIESLKKLGPEGELVATIASGTLSISDSFLTLGEKIEEGGVTMVDKIAAVANIIAQVGQIAAASAKQRIAAVDTEINAEKKRDGKSKESLAKIAALEKKKDALKRKEFETNKKMQMAQTIANTAAGVMGVWSGVKDPYIGPNLATAVSAGIIALGAAQLAIIAGTSYQGGGSVGSAPTVTTPTVSVGKRKEGVDLAKTQGGAGELAYFRGQSGTGGPEDFKPAFMGARYRATGGPTAGYVVGEQGPELFVPETPGQIVPNNEMQQSGPVTANINISALDASGVEEVLVQQRGNIIGMMREAANSYGENFMEEVDTAVYTPSSAGARKY
jgi:hypothetical protein